MRGARPIVMAAVPAAAVLAWSSHRRTVRELEGHAAVPPALTGTVCTLATSWGRLSYRLVEGSEPGPPLVLVHGWGRTADSAWWPLLGRSSQTLLAVDLPGHGRSLLDRPFTFELAAETVLAAIEHAGLERPVLVGHSMGGPIALTAVRTAGSGAFTALAALATSAYWVSARHRVVLAAAPYILAPRSPVLVRSQRAEARRAPQEATRIAWEYALRPARRVLVEAAMELRRFDARRWHDLDLPPTAWVVATRDGVIDPVHQRASAAHLGASVVEVPTEHSIVIEAPAAVERILRAVCARPSGPLLVAV
jgi:pimeloyl-ACP methyl ester carboxylesterase